MKFLEC